MHYVKRLVSAMPCHTRAAFLQRCRMVKSAGRVVRAVQSPATLCVLSFWNLIRHLCGLAFEQRSVGTLWLLGVLLKRRWRIVDALRVRCRDAVAALRVLLKRRWRSVCFVGTLCESCTCMRRFHLVSIQKLQVMISNYEKQIQLV